MNRDVCEHFNPVDLPCAKCETPTLREAAQAVLDRWDSPRWEWHQGPTAALMADLRAALAEPVLERNFCSRCGKRSFPDTIHTCTPPQAAPEGDALTAAYMLGRRYDGRRKPLTDEEIEHLAWETYLKAEGIWADDSREDLTAFARAIERAHGIGEQK